MKPAIAKLIIEANNVIGLDLELRTDYIGRGMGHNETYAITGSFSDFLQACAYAAGTLELFSVDELSALLVGASIDTPDFDLDMFCEELASIRQDQMGRYDQVWY